MRLRGSCARLRSHWDTVTGGECGQVCGQCRTQCVLVLSYWVACELERHERGRVAQGGDESRQVCQLVVGQVQRCEPRKGSQAREHVHLVVCRLQTRQRCAQRGKHGAVDSFEAWVVKVSEARWSSERDANA